MSGNTTIKIHWMDDSHNCETCGYSYAYGAKVLIDGVEVPELQFVPVAHCYEGKSYESSEVYAAILRHFGHSIVETSSL